MTDTPTDTTTAYLCDDSITLHRYCIIEDGVRIIYSSVNEWAAEDMCVRLQDTCPQHKYHTTTIYSPDVKA